MRRINTKKQRMKHLALGGVLIVALSIWMSCDNAGPPTSGGTPSSLPNWVVVGDPPSGGNATVITSTNAGVSWSKATVPSGVSTFPGISALWGVATDGTTWVAVGGNATNGIVITAKDPTGTDPDPEENWKVATVPAGVSGSLQKVVSFRKPWPSRSDPTSMQIVKGILQRLPFLCVQQREQERQSGNNILSSF